MNIRNSIKKLAEINFANETIDIGDELRNERRTIVNFLKVTNIIELDENGGFHFIGDRKQENKKNYLDNFKKKE